MTMLYPSVPMLLENVNNRYLLVNVIACRAREIAESANENKESLESKPVTAAIEEIAAGKIKANLEVIS
jgi:DNA-directed RNA polymerase subunit omega